MPEEGKTQIPTNPFPRMIVSLTKSWPAEVKKIPFPSGQAGEPRDHAALDVKDGHGDDVDAASRRPRPVDRQSPQHDRRSRRVDRHRKAAVDDDPRRAADRDGLRDVDGPVAPRGLGDDLAADGHLGQNPAKVRHGVFGLAQLLESLPVVDMKTRLERA